MTEDYPSIAQTTVRFLLKQLSILALGRSPGWRSQGEENLPKTGPLMVVGNHFSFIDPVAIVRMAPWPVEFVGGAVTPHAPLWTRIIPFLWGYQKLYRGTGSRDALRAAENVETRWDSQHFPGRWELGHCSEAAPAGHSLPGNTHRRPGASGGFLRFHPGVPLIGPGQACAVHDQYRKTDRTFQRRPVPEGITAPDWTKSDTRSCAASRA